MNNNQAMKENKPIVVTTKPKNIFRLSVSKPTFLIPFNPSRFINTKTRKSQTPNRLISPNRNSTNEQPVSSSETIKESKILVSKSSNQRSNNPSQLEEQKSLRVYHTTTLDNGNKALFTKKISSAVFKIVHKKAPSVNTATSKYTLDRYNTNIQHTNHLTMSHPSRIGNNDIFKENSKIFVNVNVNGNILNKSLNDNTRNGSKKAMANLPRCSSERASKRKLNITTQIPKKKSFTTQNSLGKKKSNNKETQEKKPLATKSLSEKKLKVNLIQEDKPKTKIASKSKSVFTNTHRDQHNNNKFSRVKIDRRQFKNMNTSPLLRTKGKTITKTDISLKNVNATRSDSKGKTSAIYSFKVMTEDQGKIMEKNNSSVIILKKYPNGNSTHNTNDHRIEDNQKKTNHPIKKKVINFESITMKGHQGKAPKKVNQDNYFIQNNINFEQSSMFVGVCDGHGMFGHEVSEYLVAHLPTMINASLITKHQPLSNQSNLNAIISDTFIRVNTRIINDDNIDTLFSGSTCISIIFTPEKITCANVGDSRAIIGKLTKGAWSSESLSRDHKPNEGDEHDRIIKAGGRVHPYKGNEGKFIGPERVWVFEKDIPGLAMSRSFGDEIAQEIGVIAKPEIIEHSLTQNDKFVVLASDGVWEFIDNEECVNMIKDFYLSNNINGALSALYEEASKRWMQKEEVIDDITAVILFLD